MWFSVINDGLLVVYNNGIINFSCSKYYYCLCILFQYRSDLENHVVDAATTSEAVGFITLMQELKRKMRSWEQQVEVFRAGEKILDRQRFQFPASWVYVDNVEGEWGAFNEIVKRKESSVQTQIGTLQMQIVTEDRAVEQKTAELLQVWEKEKPVQVCVHTISCIFKTPSCMCF